MVTMQETGHAGALADAAPPYAWREVGDCAGWTRPVASTQGGVVSFGSGALSSGRREASRR
jgi:hypothetical protein